jgi:ubiquinone/menaquinone biosynthesis C-methylase UbiE
MTVIDKILNEWSFRCHDGVVDMNDPTKVSILNEILKEHNLENLNESVELSFQNFKNVIIKSYTNGSQTIKGLENLWEAIRKNPKQKELFDFITRGNIEKSLYTTSIFLIENSKILVGAGKNLGANGILLFGAVSQLHF